MSDGNDGRGRRPGPPDRFSFRPRPSHAGQGRSTSRSEEKPPRPQARRERGEPAPSLTPDAGPPQPERIAKVIARAGVASRRDAEQMIAEGRVTLNGALLSSPATNVGPEDAVTIDGEPLPSRERTRLWLFHKPRGLVTTFRDPQARPTVFEALPEDMPRVVAVGRLDINTEGLLLLTNDGGLAKVIAHPETGWTRRYRVRAHGDVTQAELDRLRGGVTVDGMEYGPIEATLDRVQGDNIWLTLALREGKNREVKRVLEHLGIQVNRLIRLSFGPFQLGDLEQGLVEEVRTRVLKDQLGAGLATEAGVDFESPVRQPIASFGKPGRPGREEPRERLPRPRSTRPDRSFSGRKERDPEAYRPDAPRGRGREDRPETNGKRGGASQSPKRPRPNVWRVDEPEGDEPPRRVRGRREDPRADRMTSQGRSRERIGAIESPEGRRVLVERVTGGEAAGAYEAPRRPRTSRSDRADADARDGHSPRAHHRKREPRTGDKRAGPDRGYKTGRGSVEARGGAGPGAPRPSGRPDHTGGYRPGGRPGGAPGGGRGKPKGRYR